MSYKSLGSLIRQSRLVTNYNTKGIKADCIVKDNIVFGEDYDQVRYKKGTRTIQTGIVVTDESLVIRNCALEKDISMWQAGDETEVGEKGLTLR